MALKPYCYIITVFLIVLPPIAFPQVVINEIHCDPDIKTEAVEFIELYNTSSLLQDLSGWRLNDAVDYTFPTGTTIAPHGYLVVAQNPDALSAKFGTESIGPWIGKLNNDGDTIELRSAAGGKIDEVDYQLGFPWPTTGDSPGYSMELINPVFDNSIGGNWRASYAGDTAPSSSTILIDQNSSWRYFEGIREASTPSTEWRELNFDDSTWLTGTTTIGYGENFVTTELTDMCYSYTTVFLRKTFTIADPALVSELVLQAQYDDGFKAWINGVNVLNINISTGEVAYYETALSDSREDHTYATFNLSNPSQYLQEGDNVLCIQMVNATIGSSDLFWDADLSASTTPVAHGPTPGTLNSVYANNAAPQIRKVDHSPNAPQSGEEVVISAKITDPQGVDTVELFYQIVEPGEYIALSDEAYSTNWISLAMNDNGINGDELAGDSIYSASLSSDIQQHRRLVRYRIEATDGSNESITAPYADDPQPNFAYFCYDGVPSWSGAAQPGVTSTNEFSAATMRRIPAVHLLSKNSDVEDSTWNERYSGDLYKWEGTLVYDGKVYDHIRYRARGGVWRYAMCKNMWKFDFNRGHDFQARDNYGKKYDTKWTKLNLGSSIQQGNYWHRGEQGMFESVGSKLFQLADVESFNTSFMQLRIIDDANETTDSQYEGDFWGLYLAIEQQNGRFLDEHDLSDGNFYKMESGTGELNNLNSLGPTDKSDLNYILNNYTDASDAWWEANWNLESYYSYQTIVQGIHHYDISGNKNYFYYNNPETERWQVVPWDFDLTWSDNMYLDSGGGIDNIASRALDAVTGGSILTLPGDTRPIFRMQFRNRIREIRDLLYNSDQAEQVIDELANILRDPGTTNTFLDADRAMWDYNPKMDSSNYSSSLSKAGTGRYYQWQEHPEVSKDFEGGIQHMKNYVAERGALLDTLSADADIPDQPTISYAGLQDYPINGLAFITSPFNDPQGNDTFSAMEWRAGEVLDTTAPAYDPDEEPPYEINTKWESGTISNFFDVAFIPVDALKIGHAYRVRVRMQDNTGRWSHWSEPVQFIPAESDASANLTAHLRISEVMCHATEDSDFDYIELHNTSTNQTIELGGATFTSGIDYTIPDGTTLAPDAYYLLVGTTNTAAFRAHYGLTEEPPIGGTFSGGLANSGETLRLKTAAGGTVIADFEYNDGRHWPLAADGAGHSLIALTNEGQATGALDDPANWRASAYIGGSPGSADPAPPTTLLLSEIVAHTDYVDPARPEYDSDDWIEMVNTSDSAINLAGWYLSDDPSEPAKWACPAQTIVAGERITFSEVENFHNPITSGFGLDKAGEQVLLSYLPGTTGDRVADAIGFKGQENERSLSRIDDYWYATTRSKGVENSTPVDGLRISELMYFPAPLGSNDNTVAEFIEIHNPTANDITLQTVGEAWRIEGGVEFTFPENTLISAGSTLLLVDIDPSNTTSSNAFAAFYNLQNPPRMFGPWDGKLSNNSERITLVRPQAPDFVGDSYSWVVEDEIVYGSHAPWANAAGNGKSLTRIEYIQSGLDPANWSASVPTPEGTSNLPSPLTDQDHDGMSDYDEWLCGTDPADPSSIFTATGNITDGNAYTIQWLSIPDRLYSIYWTTNLLQNFNALAGDLEYPQNSYTNTLHKPQSFYKIEVRAE